MTEGNVRVIGPRDLLKRKLLWAVRGTAAASIIIRYSSDQSANW